MNFPGGGGSFSAIIIRDGKGWSGGLEFADRAHNSDILNGAVDGSRLAAPVESCRSPWASPSSTFRRRATSAVACFIPGVAWRGVFAKDVYNVPYG